jgi:hypothetical protein
MANPADHPNRYELTRLYERLADCERRLSMSERRQISSVEYAKVTVYTGGNQCTLLYPSGNSRVVKILAGYTPVVNDNVCVVNDVSGEGLVVGRKA